LLYKLFNSSLLSVSYILTPVHQVRNGGIEGKVDVAVEDHVGAHLGLQVGLSPVIAGTARPGYAR